MAPYRIVIFSALYMPHLGGVEKFSQSIAAELSKNSQVTVFCMNTEEQPAFKREGNVEVHFLPCYSLLNGRFPVPKLLAVQFVKKWFKQNRVDFGIVQCRFYLLSLLGCKVLSDHKVPFIQIEHGAGEVFMPNAVVEWGWHFYDGLLTNLEKRIPHDYYAVSHAGLRWLELYGIQGKGVISNSIAPADFDDALRTAGRWRKKHGIAENALIITFTGRIMKEKGILDLLEAFDRLQGDDLFLVAAGGGDMKLVEPWQGRKNILFPGQLSFDEIPDLLADTSIFCLPSRFVEGKPTSVLEAGYCGNAVVSANSGGTTEIIPDESCGLLIPAGDIPALTDALQRLVNHPEERQLMGRNLHQRVAEQFTWATAAREVHKAMRDCGL